mgnify:CR=1 FL=1
MIEKSNPVLLTDCPLIHCPYHPLAPHSLCLYSTIPLIRCPLVYCPSHPLPLLSTIPLTHCPSLSLSPGEQNFHFLFILCPTKAVSRSFCHSVPVLKWRLTQAIDTPRSLSAYWCCSMIHKLEVTLPLTDYMETASFTTAIICWINGDVHESTTPHFLPFPMQIKQCILLHMIFTTNTTRTASRIFTYNNYAMLMMGRLITRERLNNERLIMGQISSLTVVWPSAQYHEVDRISAIIRTIGGQMVIVWSTAKSRTKHWPHGGGQARADLMDRRDNSTWENRFAAAKPVNTVVPQHIFHDWHRG